MVGMLLRSGCVGGVRRGMAVASLSSSSLSSSSLSSSSWHLQMQRQRSVGSACVRVRALSTVSSASAASAAAASDAVAAAVDAAEQSAVEQVKHANRKQKPLYRAQLSDDNPAEPGFVFHAGVVVERLPRICIAPHPDDIVYEEEMLRRALRTRPPIPEDLRTEEPEEPELPRVPVQTDDDRANVMRSLDRSLDDSLYLLVKRDRTDHPWQLPHGEFNANEDLPLRSTAHKYLDYQVSEQLDVHMLGNAPIAYHKYLYSDDYVKQSRTANKGCKLFLFHAAYVKGSPLIGGVAQDPRIVDYAWVRKSQLPDYIQDPALLALLNDVLLTQKDMLRD